MRLEVDERVASDGRVLKKLNLGEVKSVVQRLCGLGIQSLAVCLINSFENPVHELMLKEIVRKNDPELALSISYEVLPQIREYERTSTTVTNALQKDIFLVGFKPETNNFTTTTNTIGKTKDARIKFRYDNCKRHWSEISEKP